MEIIYNKEQLKVIVDSWKNFTPISANDERELFERGVVTYPVGDDFDIEIEGMMKDEAMIVVSWGITHHKDFSEYSVLFPISTKGYTFAFQDNEEVERTESDIKSPVIFKAAEYHSAAPYRRVSKPFIALVVDMYKPED